MVMIASIISNYHIFDTDAGRITNRAIRITTLEKRTSHLWGVVTFFFYTLTFLFPAAKQKSCIFAEVSCD